MAWCARHSAFRVCQDDHAGNFDGGYGDAWRDARRRPDARARGTSQVPPLGADAASLRCQGARSLDCMEAAGGQLGGAVCPARRAHVHARAAPLRLRARVLLAQGGGYVPRRGSRIRPRRHWILLPAHLGLRHAIPAQPHHVSLHHHRVVHSLVHHFVKLTTRPRYGREKLCLRCGQIDARSLRTVRGFGETARVQESANE
mmetsp:Transcript_11564/g.22446  ORF Transcript_11564/g.22446 Transcript_11564/m.22446 type:complete len:201 (-) Transcript_11564:28-630(-)